MTKSCIEGTTKGKSPKFKIGDKVVRINGGVFGNGELVNTIEDYKPVFSGKAVPWVQRGWISERSIELFKENPKFKVGDYVRATKAVVVFEGYLNVVGKIIEVCDDSCVVKYPDGVYQTVYYKDDAVVSWPQIGDKGIWYGKEYTLVAGPDPQGTSGPYWKGKGEYSWNPIAADNYTPKEETQKEDNTMTTEETEFKMGDKVKITGNSNSSRNSIGDIGVITKKCEWDNLWKVEVEGGPDVCVWTKEFDMVKVVEGDNSVTTKETKFTRKVTTTKTELKEVINSETGNFAAISIAPCGTDKDSVKIVIGADWKDRCACHFGKEGLEELISDLQEVHDAMEY